MTDDLPPSLARFGVELERAAHRERSSPRRLRRRVAAAGALGVAAATAAITFALSATTATPLAYALTQNTDGTVTVTLENLTTGIAQLNARFAQLGIDETVIPVQAGCTTPGLVADPGARMSDSMTFHPAPAESSSRLDYFLAAEQLPNGSIGLSVGATAPPLPSCFSPRVLTVQGG